MMTTLGASYFEVLSKHVMAAQTLSGTITETLKTEHVEKTVTVRFYYKQPNLLRTEEWRDGNLTQLKVSDGKTTWTEDETLAAVYTSKSPSDGFPKSALLSDLASSGSDLSSYFEAAKQEERSGDDIHFVLSRKKTSYRVDMRRGLAVPRREVISLPGKSVTLRCDSIHFNEKISPSVFTLKPSVPVNPEDVTARLLPVGAQAPDFSATMTDGSGFQMKSFLKGPKVTVIQFWHLCVPCEAELVSLLDLERQYRAEGLRLVSVFTGPNEGSCKQAMIKMKDSDPVVLSWSTIPNIESAYRDCASPTAYIIDSQGVIRFRYVGDCSEQIKHDLKTFGIGSAPTKLAAMAIIFDTHN